MNSEIERMAKEAGLIAVNQKITPSPSIEHLAKFAALVAEDCAKEAEGRAYLPQAIAAIRAKYHMPTPETALGVGAQP